MRQKFLHISLSLVLLFNLGDRIFTSAKEKFAQTTKPAYLSRTELFQKISLEFYGVADFAEELELVNRGLEIKDVKAINNFDLIIPSRETIERLRVKRSVTELGIAAPQHKNISDRQLKNSEAEIRTENNSAELKTSSVELLVLVFAISMVLSLLIYFFKKAKKEDPIPFVVIDDEPIFDEEQLLSDLDLAQLEKSVNEQ